MALSELEQAFFEEEVITGGDDEAAAKAESDRIAAEEAVAKLEADRLLDEETKKTAEEIAAEKAIEDEKNKVVLIDPPYKGKKFIEVTDEEALYKQLHGKHAYKAMSSEEKAIAFIRQQNPELDEDEIAFTVATKYGIGIQQPADEELTDDQKIALRQQGIDRKKLISQADNYFKTAAEAIALSETDPLELDPGYKTYREQAAAQKADAVKAQEHINTINTNFDKHAVKIPEIVENIEIDIDDRKFAVPVNFKMDTKKQEQLADFAKRYQPSKAEFDAFNDPETGKFDYKGYLESLIPMAFGKELSKAATRQALSQDRDEFISKELKNSSLKDNIKPKGTYERPKDIVDAYQFG
jgi:hypothetical protein